MKLGELHCTYCLLEEKTNYVSQLESSLSGTETEKPYQSNITSQERERSFVTDRSDIYTSETNTVITNIRRRNRISHRQGKITRTSSEHRSEFTQKIKLKPKNFSTTCNVDGDKMLQRDYFEDVTITRLTDMILNTLAYKQKQHEFIKHASTLALFEAKKFQSMQNLNSKVRNCALYYNSPVYGAQRDVVIQFLKSIRFDINRALKRNATVANCCVSR